MPTSDFKRQQAQLQQFFETYAEEAAQISRFQERQSKLDGPTLVKALVLGWLQNPQASLEQLTKVCADLGVDITRQGLNARITAETVMFLALMFQHSLAHFREQVGIKPGILAYFQAVRILDSTLIELPPALRLLFASCRPGRAALKTHLCFEYLSGGLDALDWVAGDSPDQNCRLHQTLAEPRSLLLFDLGYFKQEILAEIDARQAFFTCRLQSQTAVYDRDGQRLDLVALVHTLSAPVTEVPVSIGRTVRLPVRLLIQPVPQAVADERRRKAKAKARRQKKTCSAAYLILLGFNLFITNIPADWVAAADILALYRLRWQIELIFKAWKSQLALPHLGHWRPERVFCQLYARFLGIVLCHWWVAPYRFQALPELSFAKALPLIRDYLPRLRRIMAHPTWRGLLTLLQQLKEDFFRFARKDRRKKSPSTLARLLLKT
jgi:hypothetical protein